MARRPAPAARAGAGRTRGAAAPGPAGHPLQEWARQVLGGEEPVLASCVVDYNGTLPPLRARVDAAVAEVGLGVPAGPPDAGSLVAFPVAARMALVVTPRRVLVLAVDRRGSPRRSLGSVPSDALAAAHHHPGARGDHLQVTMRSGAVVDLARRDGDPVAVVAPRHAELAGGSAPPPGAEPQEGET